MGKKNRKKAPQKSRAHIEDDEQADARSHGLINNLDVQGGLSSNNLDETLNVVAKLLRNAEKHGHTIDSHFAHHEHHLGSCDSDGAYVLMSHFTMAFHTPGAPVLSAVTAMVIRCHDNIRVTSFLPTQEPQATSFFKEFLSTQKANIGHGTVPVSYSVCAKLIKDCLLRMKESNKVLKDLEEKTVVRLYGLPTTTTPNLFQEHQILPPPAPAPGVQFLWLLLQRPEYFNWAMSEQLRDFFGVNSQDKPSTPESFQQAMRHVSQSAYNRKCIQAMMQFMAVWHALRNEKEIAAWLLWENIAITMQHQNITSDPETTASSSDPQSEIDRLESSAIFQLMINKFFHLGCGFRHCVVFPPETGLYGKGMANYLWYSQDLMQRGTLPPGIRLTASVAQRFAGTEEQHEQNNDTGRIIEVARDLSTAATCAICGTTASHGGGLLSSCSRCESVLYCSREHQLLHWRNGHKQECSKGID